MINYKLLMVMVGSIVSIKGEKTLGSERLSGENKTLGPVQFLKVETTQTYILLSWESPNNSKNFNLIYQIRYMNSGKNFQFCASKSMFEKRVSTTSTNFNLTNLEPFSKYNITLQAEDINNSGIKSEKYSKTIVTKGYRDILTTELRGVTIKFINFSMNAAKFDVENLNCRRIRGELSLQLKIECNDRACPKYYYTFNLTTLNFNCNSKFLIPFLWYKYDGKFCRHTECKRISNSFFKPNSDLEVPVNLKVKWYGNNTIDVFWTYFSEIDEIYTYKITISKINTELIPTHYLLHTGKQKFSTYKLEIDEIFPPAIYLEIQLQVMVLQYKSKPIIMRTSSYPIVPNWIDFGSFSLTTSSTSVTVTVNITKRSENRFLSSRSVIILLHDERIEVTNRTRSPKLPKFPEIALDKKSRFVAKIEFSKNKNEYVRFSVGNETSNRIYSKEHNLKYRLANNQALKENSKYYITMFFYSEFNNKYRIKEYFFNFSTLARKSQDVITSDGHVVSLKTFLYVFLILLIFMVFIVGGIITYRKTSVKFFKFKNRNSYANFPASFLSNPNQDSVHSNRSENDIPRNSFYISPIYAAAVSVTNFEKYVQTSFSTGELERQYNLLSPEQTEYSEPSIFMTNGANNINPNLVAYDRAVDNSSEDEHCFYINASYINGYNVPRAYIAAQNPKTDNFESFWRMIWQTNVKHIFMISNIHGGDEESIDQFWPDINEELIFRDISVKNILTKVLAYLEIRTFKVKRNNEERKVEKTLFTCWPRDDIPLYHQSLIPFIRKMLRVPLSYSNPIIVQCSNGVGKTGTILLIDISLRRSCDNGDVDIFKNLRKLRHQKTNMVDHVNQYKLAHLVVLQLLTGSETSIPCSQMNDMAVKIIDEEEYKIQMDYLRRIEWQNHVMEKTQDYTEIFVTYSEKNRIQNIIPGDFGRVFLEKYPKDDVSSSYINAVQVDGYKCPGRYIVTQQPMPNTVGDFWRLVDEQSISVIVSMNEVVLEDKTCCIFIPSADDSVLRPVDYLLVLCKEEIECPDYSIFYLQVGNSYKREKMDVEVIVFKKWPAKSLLPYNCEEFLSFWEEADRMSKKSKRILITCFDGATASGVFVALSFIIEKMKAEQECDVCQAVQIVRHNRKQFVTDEKQYTFLFVAAIRFINGFQDYANFQKK